MLFMVAWLLAVPAMYIRSSIHLQHFYLMTIFPAPFVLIGAWIEDCIFGIDKRTDSRLLKFIGSIVTGFLVLIVLWWSSLWIVRIRFEARGLLERITRGWLMDRTGEVIADYLREHPDSEIIVLADFGGEMSTFNWLQGYLQTDAVRVIAYGQGFLIPEGSMCYMLGPGVPQQTLSPAADFLTERSELTIPATPPWRFFCGTSTGNGRALLAEWENGLKLLNTEVTGKLQRGEQLDIVHTWEFGGAEFGRYHFYNHLLLAGNLVSQVDGRGIPYWYWRDGDTLLTYFTLLLPEELPEGNYDLRIGLYTWPGLQRVSRLTGEDGYSAFEFTVPAP
jgi:hypothetical protein